MNIRSTIILLITLCAFSVSGMAGETKPAKYWYEVTVQEGSKIQAYSGTSEYPPDEFAKILGGTESIMIDNVAIFVGPTLIAAMDSTKRKARMFINPRFVVYFQEWAADPKTLFKKQ